MIFDVTNGHPLAKSHKRIYAVHNTDIGKSFYADYAIFFPSKDSSPVDV